MKFVSKKFFAVSLFVVVSNLAYATHLMGGFISYKYLSGTTYEVKLTIFRDCNSDTPFDGIPSTLQLDINAQIGIFESTSGSLVDTFNFSTPDTIRFNAVYDSVCPLQNTMYCITRGVYTGNITLPSDSHNYTLTYQRCCMSSTVTNVLNPIEVGETFTAFIPRTDSFHNSSPVFANIAPVFFYVNHLLVFSASATDSDGDSLQYSLCEPFIGSVSSNAAPHPPANPPYNALIFYPPYNLNNLMGGVPITIDSAGIITGIPNTIGSFVIGICIREFRNGQLFDSALSILNLNVDHCENVSYLPKVSDWQNLALSPTPATSQIIIETENAYPFDISLFDITGKCIRTIKSNTGNHTSINVEDLPSGYYFLKIADGNFTTTKRFVIAR